MTISWSTSGEAHSPNTDLLLSPVRTSVVTYARDSSAVSSAEGNAMLPIDLWKCAYTHTHIHTQVLRRVCYSETVCLAEGLGVGWAVLVVLVDLGGWCWWAWWWRWSRRWAGVGGGDGGGDRVQIGGGFEVGLVVEEGLMWGC